MADFIFDDDLTEVENVITNFIYDVIMNIEDNVMYKLLRENEFIEITIPRMEVGNYVINEFIAKIPREKVEEMLFNV